MKKYRIKYWERTLESLPWMMETQVVEVENEDKALQRFEEMRFSAEYFESTTLRLISIKEV